MKKTLQILIILALSVLIFGLTTFSSAKKKVVSGNSKIMDDTGYTTYTFGWPNEFMSKSSFRVVGTPTVHGEINWGAAGINYVYSLAAASALVVGAVFLTKIKPRV